MNNTQRKYTWEAFSRSVDNQPSFDEFLRAMCKLPYPQYVIKTLTTKSLMTKYLGKEGEGLPIGTTVRIRMPIRLTLDNVKSYAS